MVHPRSRWIIQTFCLPVSLIAVAPMAESMIRLAVTGFTGLFELAGMCRHERRCCRESIS